MKIEGQQGKGHLPVYCTECHMYDYLPHGQESWVCARCKELLALREQICSLEAKVVDLEKLRETERHVDETFRDVIEASHSRASSSSTVRENEGLGQGGHRSEEEGNAPLEGTPSVDDEPISSRTGDTPLGGGGLLVVGDSIIRGIERWVCDPRVDRTVTCLPGAKVADIMQCLDRLLGSAGEETVVVVHVGTNDVGKCSREVLEAKFRLIGSILKSRTPKLAFSEMLPVARASTVRQAELRGFNAWMRRWCREEGFRFVRHWDTFWGKQVLYKRDRLHLNQDGTRLLVLKIKKVAEQLLK
ncbi:uncharacterized protein LOC128348917 [Hemicordylus capensis]|uniref:uncharacterized protein LOC128348917 n=1 Tax=Hemicordylus capensis TaxID=884348 RepID=UPI0023043C08|nr:uncharacterized protein LOC128348917 [Hemicordylus capensis]XP_053160637.1 uncharacterized protein LOC128348917 [Hemicordylus capensis]XP_053160638.1 uncharacterized protein LOC128348917 [Hemicordylus capensis]XP_053160639.1 uncharacterized protein LOC128348917 [Hemicordylus capensis]XP_053160640.1 uncharacterized protein LOC128348917 [Hemicordylus capensis]XP_053160641.1 uncharacterized protein LOC128348917 [Hemicordylus capensis]XP_053160642.1 uncharacterized protein LOC128348917 [Hemico